MRVIDARSDDEFVVARAICGECEEPIEQWCTPLEDNGVAYPPVYTWKHARDGVVLCEKPRWAHPRDGSVEMVWTGE